MDEQPKVAGDVAGAIVGLPRRRKDDRWDWAEQSRRSLEAAVASWVIAILEADGHRITDLRSPDYERDRDPEQLTRPELAMRLDGEAAALDVTMFTTNDASRAGARGDAIREAIEAHLTSLDEGRSFLGVVAFDRAGLIALNTRQVREGTAVLVDAYMAAVQSSLSTTDRLQLDVHLPWIRGASLTITKALPRRRWVSIYVREPRGDIASQVDAFILERIGKKASQLKPWGRGILVIVHGFDETAEDVRAGFDRLGHSPLWRVYWAGPSPELVELVASG